MNVDSSPRPARAGRRAGEPAADACPHRRRRWRRVAAAAAQVLAVCTAGSTSSSQRLADLGVRAPTTQLFVNYLLLAAVYAPLALWMRRRRRRRRRRRPRHTNGPPAPPPAAPPSPPLKPSSGRALFAPPPPPPPEPQTGWWRYLALAALDAEANALVTAAIPWGHATVTSATLLGCLSVPAAMALSGLFLGRRYSARHAVGAAVCVGGLAVLVLADAAGGGGKAGGGGGGGGGKAESELRPPPSWSPVLGDLLAAAGAVLYAASNVWQERFLVGRPSGGGDDDQEEDDADDDEPAAAIAAAEAAASSPPSPAAPLLSLVYPAVRLLAALGAFGAAITGVQSLLFERAQLAALLSPSPLPGGGPSFAAGSPPLLIWRAAPAFASFAAFLFLFYSLLPGVLAAGGATMLNLSLLTGNLWAAAARVAFFGGFASPLELRSFAVALALVAGGIGLYATAPDAGEQAAAAAGPDEGGAYAAVSCGEREDDGQAAA